MFICPRMFNMLNMRALSCLIAHFYGAMFPKNGRGNYGPGSTGAPTTVAVRRTKNSQDSLRVLAARYGIKHETIATWKKRASTADLPAGAKMPKSTVLSVEEEAIIGAFRRHTLLPLDNCLYTLRATIPNLICSPCAVVSSDTIYPVFLRRSSIRWRDGTVTGFAQCERRQA